MLVLLILTAVHPPRPCHHAHVCCKPTFRNYRTASLAPYLSALAPLGPHLKRLELECCPESTWRSPWPADVQAMLAQHFRGVEVLAGSWGDLDSWPGEEGEDDGSDGELE